MNHPESAGVFLRVPAEIGQMPLMRLFIEETARRNGFADGDCLKLALAGEEIFSYVCSLETNDKGPDAPVDAHIDVRIEPVDYQLRIRLDFDARRFDPRAFNIGAPISPDDEESLQGLGLLLASRMVDRLAIDFGENGRMALRLAKNRAYPPTPPIAAPAWLADPSCGLRDAQPEDIRQFSAWIQTVYAAGNYPAFLASAGELIDRVAVNDPAMLVAVDAQGGVQGAVLWRELSPRALECFGPYLAAPDDAPAVDLAADLFDKLLGRVAKSRALCLLNRWPAPASLSNAMESLGAICLSQAGGAPQRLPVAYRQLKEDTGSRVWAARELESFLNAEYARLCFAREMVIAEAAGERRPEHSVFSAVIDRARRLVSLAAIADGLDAEANLRRQLDAFAANGLLHVLFEIDLASAWQAALAPLLMSNGFAPVLVMPYAGLGDIVLFQKTPAS